MIVATNTGILIQTTIFSDPHQVFVCAWTQPELNHTERNSKFNLNKCEDATQRNIQFEFICGFAEMYRAEVYSGGWVQTRAADLSD